MCVGISLESQCRVSLAMIIAVIGVDKNVTPGAIICLSSEKETRKKRIFCRISHFSHVHSPLQRSIAMNYTLNIHVKSHDDECGVTFMIKWQRENVAEDGGGSKINLIFMILMILSGVSDRTSERKRDEQQITCLQNMEWIDEICQI